KARIEKVLSFRTNYLTFVLEDIFQSQNASATIRTGEILGLSDVHVIEKKNKHTLNPDVTLGSSQWINLNKYKNAKFAIDRLKSDGFMYSLLMRLRKSSIDYLLNEAEKSNLRLKYYRQVVKNYQFIENLINS
ncbi:TrmH family RNA methyltransferase, partial [Borreliella burgdorferi]|nr:TrmH family RNA methyltransferase [Borreliella burgdorferi]